MAELVELHKEVHQLKNSEKAKILARFFKTGKGEYGEGDVFYGLTVPQSRTIARAYRELKLSDVAKLLRSKVHEERLIALLILVSRFQKGDGVEQKRIYNFYLKNTQYVNNWDLVDLTAHKIVGEYIVDRPRDVLCQLAVSKHLWERRIAIIATFAFIKRGDLADALKLSQMLLGDTHDLIHKAVGWVLREVGKQSMPHLEAFLKKHVAVMPRTTLRYAIERFPEEKRQRYLTMEVSS